MTLPDRSLDQLIERIIESKVGGTYWGSQPRLPDPGYALIRSRDAKARRGARELATTVLEVAQDAVVDPWHVLSGAATVVVDSDDELALLAAMTRIPVQLVGHGRFSSLSDGRRSSIRQAFRTAAVSGVCYRNPFDGTEIDLASAIDLCAFWRRSIDTNRGLTAALGFAFWKRQTVAPLLWGGTSHVPFVSYGRSFAPTDRVAVWKARTAPRALKGLQLSGAELVEVEDGFIRSAGLGAECVPPLSIVVDSLGIYFDPRRASDLERLLQEGTFEPEILLRARQLREFIVQAGISKYGAGAAKLDRRGTKPHLLVVGQVEDDRAVLAGLGPTTNLDLLRKVREANPGDHIIYRPHPDVEAGHRRGAIPDDECLDFANEIIRTGPISSSIDLVDEVHVNTSLAGFEGLLRGKAVVTYGVPFYAGWGLSRDFGPIPNRRNAKRSIDELVAAALLLYPRYLDPVTGLPCPPEILVRRIAEGSFSTQATRLVRIRRLQGKWKRILARSRPAGK